MVEADLLKTLESSQDSQLKLIAPEDEKNSIIKQQILFNVSSFHSQLAISRENAFMKSKRAAEKEAAKKKAVDTAMDTSADARVVDVLDQRLKQLGLISLHVYTLIRTYVLDSLTDNVTPYGVKAVQCTQHYLKCVCSGPSTNLKPVWLKVANLLPCNRPIRIMYVTFRFSDKRE